MTQEITSKMLDLNGKPFEVFMCGDQKSDKLALFLHGFPETAYSWQLQMKLLADMGYKCWAPNQRGYGESYAPQNINDYHINNLIKDVTDLIDASKCQSVTLIGHDWGASVAWQFAILKIRPLDKLVIMNVPHPIRFWAELKKLRQLIRSYYVFLYQIPKINEFTLTVFNGLFAKMLLSLYIVRKENYTHDIMNVYIRHLLKKGRLKSMMNWYRAYFRNYKAIQAELTPFLKEKLKVPTLMIWGEVDHAISIHTSLGTGAYVENFTVRYIPKTGHFVQQEAPEEVNSILKAWLEEKPVPGNDKPSTLQKKQV